ncbi:hypothetical protein QP178_01080 [Sphingomonas aurantiaca]|uniref:hypothetical protein n=1 Tax=Sphingomonas aurantiaca TaxID=185949 RepID=UPI002FE31371
MVIAAFPDTPIGIALRHALIDRPAARLMRVTRGDAAVMVLLMMTAAMVTLVGEGDGIGMLAMGAPDIAVWITTFEVSAYVDVIIALGAAASGLHLRGAIAGYAGIFARGGRARATDRARRSRKMRPSAADNDDEPGLLARVA